MKKLFTSESVTEGHPDKMCDKISDAVLDEILERDPFGRVACETCCTTGLVLVTGEISTTANVDIAKIARRTVSNIGYNNPEAGFDGNGCAVLVSIDEQSPDIERGTNDVVGGAGDQGMMFGYACRETEDLMPLPITLANEMAYRLAVARKLELIRGLLPDGKTQVTIEYDEMGMPCKVDTVVISAQHKKWMRPKDLQEQLVEYVIRPALQRVCNSVDTDVDNYKLYINPTGRFVKGGPAADTGLTGRKIIVDTYGGYAAHGGGAFSGKDPTKVDRSAAYAARHVAKNIIAANMADKCQVQLAYAIGMPEPVSIRVDTFGTGKYPEQRICQAVQRTFDLTPRGIINRLDLRRPIYGGTAAYGHFGTIIGESRTWEQTDCKDELLNNI